MKIFEEKEFFVIHFLNNLLLNVFYFVFQSSNFNHLYIYHFYKLLSLLSTVSKVRNINVASTMIKKLPHYKMHIQISPKKLNSFFLHPGKSLLSDCQYFHAPLLLYESPSTLLYRYRLLDYRYHLYRFRCDNHHLLIIN